MVAHLWCSIKHEASEKDTASPGQAWHCPAGSASGAGFIAGSTCGGGGLSSEFRRSSWAGRTESDGGYAREVRQGVAMQCDGHSPRSGPVTPYLMQFAFRAPTSLPGLEKRIATASSSGVWAGAVTDWVREGWRGTCRVLRGKPTPRRSRRVWRMNAKARSGAVGLGSGLWGRTATKQGAWQNAVPSSARHFGATLAAVRGVGYRATPFRRRRPFKRTPKYVRNQARLVTAASPHVTPSNPLPSLHLPAWRRPEHGQKKMQKTIRKSPLSQSLPTPPTCRRRPWSRSLMSPDRVTRHPSWHPEGGHLHDGLTGRSP